MPLEFLTLVALAMLVLVAVPLAAHLCGYITHGVLRRALMRRYCNKHGFGTIVSVEKRAFIVGDGEMRERNRSLWWSVYRVTTSHDVTVYAAIHNLLTLLLDEFSTRQSQT